MRKDNFLQILASGLLLLLTTSISFPAQSWPQSVLKVANSIGQTEKDFPVLDAQAKRPKISAKTAYVLDLSSGKVLFAQNPDAPILPASTTKIATAVVSLSHFNLDDVLTVGDLEVDGQKMELEKDEKISVRSLLYGLLVFSANDAAEVLATSYPGGREAFVAAMNTLSKRLGLTNTNFANPTGLDEYLHFSSARDLVLLTSHALENPVFGEIVSTSQKEVSSLDGKTRHELVNLNQLLGKVPGVLGVKTGWTVNSGENLVTFVDRDGRRILLSVIGSQDRFGETEKLIDWIYESYSWE